MARYDKQLIQAPPLGPDILDNSFMTEYFQLLVSAIVSGHYDVDLPQDAALGLIRSKDDGAGGVEITFYDGTTEHVIATWDGTDGLRIVATAGFDASASWQDLLASRTHSTSYQNTSGHPIAVFIRGQSTVTSSRDVQVSTDNSSWIDVSAVNASNLDINNAFLIVPNGHYYRINGASTLFIWSEMRA